MPVFMFPSYINFCIWFPALAGCAKLGAGQMSFACSLRPVSGALEVYPAVSVPQLLELDESLGGKTGMGILLSSVFALPVHNAQSHSVTLTARLESPRGCDGE
jgi:hypothetical protein